MELSGVLQLISSDFGQTEEEIKSPNNLNYEKKVKELDDLISIFQIQKQKDYRDAAEMIIY